MRTRCGLTLFEMLVALSLLAVVGLVTAQLFRGTINVHRETSAAHDALSRSQRLADRLRRDAWGAAAIESVDGKLRLTDVGGVAVAWGVEEGTTLVRESGDEPHRWQMGMPVSLAAEGPAVVLRLGKPDSSDASTMRFISQIMLAKEGR